MADDDARREVLARIGAAIDPVRAADPDVAAGELPRAYGTRGDAAGHLELLEERLADYGVHVLRTRGDALPRDLADELARRRVRRLVVPEGLPDAWLADASDVMRVPEDAPSADLDGSDGVVTACATAVAATGTIVLDGGPGQGRRAATLVPDLHLCVVRASQVVGTVPEAVAVLADAVRAGRPLTWISGPSATSDIELVRVGGVHGPRTLVVLLRMDR